MKKLLIISLLIFSNLQAKTLLTCLGAEEAKYAKNKYTGPNYRLNQEMILEISSVSSLIITKQAYNRICQDKKYPSLNLLRELTIGQQTIFEQENGTSLEYVNLRALKENAGHLLIKYLFYVQSLSRDPKCIEKNIKGVKELYSRYRYLEDDLSTKQLIGKQGEINQIFNKLEDIDELLKKCEKDFSKNKM